VITSKNRVIPEVMTLFREADRQEFTRSLSDAGCLPEDPRDDDFDDDETVLVREYSVETWKAIERLKATSRQVVYEALCSDLELLAQPAMSAGTTS
jgi:DNA-directed RNA polymerase specialized sigma24 family protein